MYKQCKELNMCSPYPFMPVRLVAVKKILEALQMFSEALCQTGEVVQGAES